ASLSETSSLSGLSRTEPDLSNSLVVPLAIGAVELHRVLIALDVEALRCRTIFVRSGGVCTEVAIDDRSGGGGLSSCALLLRLSTGVSSLVGLLSLLSLVGLRRGLG